MWGKYEEMVLKRYLGTQLVGFRGVGTCVQNIRKNIQTLFRITASLDFSFGFLYFTTSQSFLLIPLQSFLSSYNFWCVFVFMLEDLWSPCPSACLPCRRELSYFGVKVVMIEPGYFKTAVTIPKALSQGFQASWNQASPEIKELYGEKFMANREWSVDLGK